MNIIPSLLIIINVMGYTAQMDSVLLTIDDTLLVRSWTLADAPALFSLVDSNREHLSVWLPWVPYVKEVKDSENFIRDAIKEAQENKGLELGIFSNNQLVGCIGLHELDFTHHKTSIGYWLGSQFQGKGIMVQSVKALMDYCFTVHNMNRIEIRCGVGNAKSRAIPQKLGFTQEGILRQAEFIGGSYIDNFVYSFLKSDSLF